ncbi:hypothetical protein PV350_23570 [Streptomyces sp. PA03-6a]|nr:hypothetical protein [Streptomyces sp. PA03-6a]
MSCLKCESMTADLLCTGCRLTLSSALRTAESSYVALGEHLAPRSVSGVRRFSGIKPTPALPLRESTADLRAEIVTVLCEWASALTEARGWIDPKHHGTHEGRVRRAAALLDASLGWASEEWIAVGDLAVEVEELDRSIRSVLDPPTGEKRVRMGVCPAITPVGKCGAVLWHTPGAKALTCDWCQTVYPPVVWLELKQWMDEDAEETA